MTGITHSTEGELRRLIESEMPLYEESGLQVTTQLYLAEGEKPGQAGTLIPILAGLGVLLLLCLGTFLFPSTVFGPQPVREPVPSGGGVPAVKATGRFQNLKKVEPEIQIGKGTRRFREAEANLIVRPGESRLLIYIQYVVRSYGLITVGRSHWGTFLEPHAIDRVEPGLLYGWRERPAVRFLYRDKKGKAQELIVSFGHTGAQAEFVDLLRQNGFSVA